MKLTLIAILILSGTMLKAGTPDFRNLNKQALKDVSKEFHGNFIPTTVSGASNLGRLWGVEVGLVANKTSSPKIEKVSQDSFDKLYSAALIGRADIIYGLGAEVTMLPFKVGALKLKTYSFGVKWTLTEVFKAIPFNIKLKAFYNTADISYKDSESGVNYTVDYTLKGQGFNVTFSKKILLLEPYIGIGYVRGESDIEANGSTSFFGTTITQGIDNKGIKSSGTHFFAGITANLIAIDLGLEYSRVLGTDRVAAKLAFGI